MKWRVSTLKTRLDKVCSYSLISLIATESHDSSIGGSLGWKTRGSLHGDFEKVAYELETSTTSNPKIGEAKTSHGSVEIIPCPALFIVTKTPSQLPYHHGRGS